MILAFLAGVNEIATFIHCNVFSLEPATDALFAEDRDAVMLLLYVDLPDAVLPTGLYNIELQRRKVTL